MNETGYHYKETRLKEHMPPPPMHAVTMQHIMLVKMEMMYASGNNKVTSDNMHTAVFTLIWALSTEVLEMLCTMQLLGLGSPLK